MKLEIDKLNKDLCKKTEENSILSEENNKLKLKINNNKQSTINFIASFDSGNFAFFNSQIFISRTKSNFETKSNQAFPDYWGN